MPSGGWVRCTEVERMCLSEMPDFQAFCRAYAVGDIMRLTRDDRRCFETQLSPTMAQIDNMYGKGMAGTWVATILTFMNEMRPEGRRMTPQQIVFSSSFLASSFPYLKASEILLFFRRAMGGAYGKLFYGAMDGHDLGAALREHFLKERARMYDRIETERRREKEEREREEAVYDPERMAAIMERLNSKLGAVHGK